MSHATQEQLLRFTQGVLPEDMTIALYSHLVECDRCELRMRALKALRADFSAYWDRWLEHYGQCARIRDPGVTSALDSEGRDVRPVYAIAARILIDAASKIAAVGSRGLTEWMIGDRRYAFAVQHQYAGVGDPQSVRGAKILIADGSQLLGEGESESARALFDDAVGLLPRCMEKAELNVTDEANEKAICLHMNARRSSVAVLMYGTERLVQPWHAVLATREGHEVDSKPLAPVPGAEYLLSEFLGVDDGEYVVAVRSR